jgi:hypothetical protein
MQNWLIALLLGAALGIGGMTAFFTMMRCCSRTDEIDEHGMILTGSAIATIVGIATFLVSGLVLVFS